MKIVEKYLHLKIAKIFLEECPPTRLAGQAAMQLSSEPGHCPPVPPDPPRAYMDWFLVFI